MLVFLHSLQTKTDRNLGLQGEDGLDFQGCAVKDPKSGTARGGVLVHAPMDTSDKDKQPHVPFAFENLNKTQGPRPCPQWAF